MSAQSIGASQISGGQVPAEMWRLEQALAAPMEHPKVLEGESQSAVSAPAGIRAPAVHGSRVRARPERSRPHSGPLPDLVALSSSHVGEHPGAEMF